MRLDEIKEYNKEGKFVEKCSSCGKECEARTQRDEDPEYYTTVYFLCICGEYVEFILPVN
jgi:hypothetical protein